MHMNALSFMQMILYSVDSRCLEVEGPTETLRHIRFAELRKIPIEQPNFTNEHVI